MDIRWSPVKKNQFVTWGEEILLHEVSEIDPNNVSKSRSLLLSETEQASVVARISDFPFPRAVDAYPGSFLEAEGIIAVGLTNGKVVLTSFGGTMLKKEFAPKHSRQVNCLCWNRSSPELLAVGLDKARADYSVVVWDIAASGKLANSFHSDAVRPFCELGVSEVANSIVWYQQKTILAGMNGKHIRHHDLREPLSKVVSTASTKATYGLCIDSANRLASYAESQVVVWDIRNFEKPFVVINHNKPIAKILWSPSRPGLLACSEKDSDLIILHDVQMAASAIEDGEPPVLDRRLMPFQEAEVNGNPGSPSIATFAWNPHEESMLTSVSYSGAIRNTIVYERITLNWSSRSKLGWSDGKKTIQYIDNTDEIYASLSDISIKMKQRAIAGYGLAANLKDNAKFVEDTEIATIWEWLEYSKTVTDKEKYRVPYIGALKFPGARIALRLDASHGMNQGSLKSDTYSGSFDSHSNINISKIFKCEERTFTQQILGWDADLNESSGSTLRKAAISLFHLKLRQCISVLSDSGNSIIGMAVAGFSEAKNTLWKEMAEQNSMNLDDPYVRAIFFFLTDVDGNYDSILRDSQISVADRVGFACTFLSDAKITSFLNDLLKELISTGSLEGLLLTGMTSHVVPVLQRYLDFTGDIQTVSLLAIRTMPELIQTNPQLNFWIEQYRELLDAWKLWELRAELDILTNTTNHSLISPADVTISCNFCGKNISPSGVVGPGRSLSLFHRFQSNNPKAKLSCCPSCRKPLPRCAICLLNMGTILGLSKVSGSKMASPEALSWYTWCQTCRHGGHTLHLQEWFTSQIECPVTGCSCKCNSLDKVIDFPS